LPECDSGGTALGGVFDHYVAGKAAAPINSLADGAAGSKLAGQSHAEVLGFLYLKNSQHALAAGYGGFAGGQDFLSHGEDTGLAGNQ